MSDATQEARELIADARAGRLDVDGLAGTAKVLLRAIRLLEALCEEVDTAKEDTSLEAAQAKFLESQRVALRDALVEQRELAASRLNRCVDLSAEVSRLQTELEAVLATAKTLEASTRSAVGLLDQVMRGTYRWPDGVAWAVREAHSRLTGGPPDGVYGRAQGGSAAHGPDRSAEEG